jgi:hypothetical protein
MKQAVRQHRNSSTTVLPAADRSDVEAYYRTTAAFYDAELADRRDLGFWRWIAERHRGGRHLELGCGSGRVTAVLAVAVRELIVEARRPLTGA